MKLRTSTPRIQVEYVRSFSALGALQKAHRIRYQLSLTQDGCLLCLRQEQDAVERSEQVLLYCGGFMAYQLLLFLYENAVQMENWRDLVEELLPEGVCGT